jgi:hypothetical protein
MEHTYKWLASNDHRSFGVQREKVMLKVETNINRAKEEIGTNYSSCASRVSVMGKGLGPWYVFSNDSFLKSFLPKNPHLYGTISFQIVNKAESGRGTVASPKCFRRKLLPRSTQL